jgi:uncharacterized protein YbjT (DUF2867 family)
MALPTASSSRKVVVVGATGATGKHVVQMLLDGGHQVIACARSKEKMLSLLVQKDYGHNLVVKEASIADLSAQDLTDLTQGCDAVVR